VRCRELRRFPGHVTGFVPVWALAVWAALRFVPASCAFAFSRCCFVVSFSYLWGWFVVPRLEASRNSSAVAFDPNDVTGEEERSGTENHKTPDRENLPICMTGSAWAQGAFALAPDWAWFKIIDHSTSEQVGRNLVTIVWMAFDHMDLRFLGFSVGSVQETNQIWRQDSPVVRPPTRRPTLHKV
jgi:hypothetical protein